MLVLTERVIHETYTETESPASPPAEGGVRKYVQAFAGTQLVTILGTTHGLKTADLLVQCYDAQSPRRSIDVAWSVDPVTYDVRVAFSQLQSGRVVLLG